MNLIDKYILYLVLTEREWVTPDDHKDSFSVKNFEDLFAQKIGLDVFRKMRHALQPSMYDIYIKNYLGDYMGRPDTMNSQTMRHIGFEKFKKDLDKLIQRAKFARKEKDKIPANFFKPVSGVGETNDPDVNTGESEGGDAGGDGGDGGDGGGAV